MPHVALISLSGFRICEAELMQFGMTLPGFQERIQALSALPALGLLTLAGQTPAHWTCSYHAPSQVTEELTEQIVAEAPHLVAISALTASIKDAYALSDRLRRCGIRTVLGGLHVTTCHAEALQHADCVVTGSGEAVWQELLSDAENDALQTEYRVPRAMLKAHPWPVPRFDLLGNVPRYTLQTQRGCPLACDFCAASRLLETFREKPAAAIGQELQAIKKLSRDPLIELADDNTFVGHRNMDEFLDLFEQSGVRWFTESDWRLGERKELLPRLAAAGCLQILMGIESIVLRYPGMGGKQAELDRILDAVEEIQAAGVAVNACFILGADGETRESMDRLTAFLLEAPFADVQVTLQTPFPGTMLRQRLQRERRLLSERGWPYYSLFEVTYQPDCLSVAELEFGFREVMANVFGPAATQRRQRHRTSIWRQNPRLAGSRFS